MALPGSMGRRLLLGVVFGALVYALLAIWADIGAVRATLATFPLYLLPVAMALSFLNYCVRFARWEHYRKLLAIDLDRRTSFTIYLAGLALTVTPGKMGETFKSWLVRRVTGTRVHKSAPIVVAERVTDLLGFLVLIAIGGLATQPEYAWIFWAALGLCGALLALISSRRATSVALAMVARTPGVRRLVPKVEVSIESARVLLAPRQLLGPTVIATIGWSLECTAFWLIARALAPGAIPYLFALYTFALSAVAGAVLILFPGGLGVTEASMGALLRRRYMAAGIAADAANAKAVSATLLIRLCTLWFAVGVGLVATYVFTRRFGDVGAEARTAAAESGE
jgi:uncharacterized protein (TIRG00374 family)